MTPDTLQTIGVIIALIASAFTVYANLRKLPIEMRSSDADLSAKYAKLASDTAEENVKLREDVEKLRTEIDTLCEQQKADVKDLASKLQEQIGRADKFENWARRLVSQLESLDIVPVPLDITVIRPGAVK